MEWGPTARDMRNGIRDLPHRSTPGFALWNSKAIPPNKGFEFLNNDTIENVQVRATSSRGVCSWYMREKT